VASNPVSGRLYFIVIEYKILPAKDSFIMQFQAGIWPLLFRVHEKDFNLNG